MHVVILAKLPRAGRVKTRLAGEIGVVPALTFYRANLQGLVRRLSADSRWKLWLSVTPDAAVGEVRGLPGGCGRLPQGAGDLGQRMARSMTRFGMAPVVLIGSDIPGIARAHVARAFRELRRNDLVFGPSPDGGFWLVGAASGARLGAIFDNVRWSSPHALADTRANIRPGVRVALVDELADIDDAEAYRNWRS